ncbi:MAG: helix-turn-helix domain-containing protein [Arcobacteraceae bacterium]|jgi:transcriptional regulator with XRE-family HTH domain|nr:helix-turn-helix domain-containing protein [Arcobacteraceae bacterium]
MSKFADEIDLQLIDIFHKQVGKNVKHMRETKGYSQLRLSQLLGHKSVGLVSQAEVYHKKQHFNLTHLYKLAYVLECDIKEFFKDTNTNPIK